MITGLAGKRTLTAIETHHVPPITRSKARVLSPPPPPFFLLIQIFLAAGTASSAWATTTAA